MDGSSVSYVVAATTTIGIADFYGTLGRRGTNVAGNPNQLAKLAYARATQNDIVQHPGLAVWVALKLLADALHIVRLKNGGLPGYGHSHSQCSAKRL